MKGYKRICIIILVAVLLCSILLTGCRIKESLYDLSVIDKQKITGEKSMLSSAEFGSVRIDEHLLLFPVFVCTRRGDGERSLNDEFKPYLMAYTDEATCGLRVISAELTDADGNSLAQIGNDADFAWKTENELWKGELAFDDNAISLPHAELNGSDSFVMTVRYCINASSVDEHEISYTVSVDESVMLFPFLGM